jgi:hypothetical protein
LANWAGRRWSALDALVSIREDLRQILKLGLWQIGSGTGNINEVPRCGAKTWIGRPLPDSTSSRTT